MRSQNLNNELNFRLYRSARCIKRKIKRLEGIMIDIKITVSLRTIYRIVMYGLIIITADIWLIREAGFKSFYRITWPEIDIATPSPGNRILSNVYLWYSMFRKLLMKISHFSNQHPCSSSTIWILHFAN